MLCIKATCENIDGRKAIGLVWMSENMYTDTALNIEAILLDEIETGLILNEEEE
jgi:hypothetical protein